MSTTLDTLALGHRFASDLPELALAWQAEPAPEPRLLVLNSPLADELGLDASLLRGEAGLGLLLGTGLPPGATPVAQGYAGHQFGGWSPRLGDGRALLLGELVDRDGGTRDLHLKGSGRTPFSRGGDGFAVIGPMLREYVVSEAMHALGIPTTRSLAVVATGRDVVRERVEKGAVLARVASSHLRVGTFQYAASSGDRSLLERLVDHAIDRHHPAARSADNAALALFDAVVSAQASLIAQWMLVGFVHGVMNTDNMTISGETIDYGPCAFIDAFDPAAVFSSIDHGGRYAYGRQPVVAEWNLARLAETLLPLVDDTPERAAELATEVLGRFRDRYSAAWYSGLRAKLGLPDGLAEDVLAPLSTDLFALLEAGHVDFTSFFRALGRAARGDREPARSLVLDLGAADAWLDTWLALSPDPGVMDRANPAYVPRNHLVEEALAAATDGSLDPLHTLLDAVTAPYDERPGLERHLEPAPDSFGHYTTYCGT